VRRKTSKPTDRSRNSVGSEFQNNDNHPVYFSYCSYV